jgi:hypothetical protein
MGNDQKDDLWLEISSMFGEGKKLGMRGGPPVPFRKDLAGMM